MKEERVERPNKVLQFGEGNFLRAFVDYIIDCSNKAGVFDGNITIVKPIDFGNLDRFKNQDNLYTVILRGMQDGETLVTNHVVSSVVQTVDPFTEYEKYNQLMEEPEFRFIVSNTTEAGIAFCDSDKFEDTIPSGFPGKLTKLLYQRYQLFNGAMDKGFIFLPVELIEKNGDNLKKCIMQYIDLWNLEEDFKNWVETANIFCNTLVDRIVSGYPKAEENTIWEKLGYKDELMVTGEPFGFWAIGSDRIEEVQKELTLKSDVEIVFAKDIEPYKQRKVRILNGAHTSMVLGAYCYGLNTVEECMNDDVVRQYMTACIFNEIIPNINLAEKELNDFANSVVERFRNPFLNHQLLDISLNSTSKWLARVMPSFMDYYKNNGQLPKYLTFSFAAYMAFYMGLTKSEDGFVNQRGEEFYPVRDDQYVLEKYADIAQLDIKTQVNTIMSDTKLWGQELTQINDFESMVCKHILDIQDKGMKQTLRQVIEG